MWQRYPRTLGGIASALGCGILSDIAKLTFHSDGAAMMLFGICLGVFFTTMALAMPYEL